MQYLRKKDLVDALGVAKSTVSDWVTEFRVYIPIERDGNLLYYRPEALDVLNVIKDLRHQGYSKASIMQLLTERGFPITVEEAVEDIQQIINHADYRDTLLQVMHGVTQAIQALSEQNKQIDRQDERMDGLEQQLDNLRKEVASAKAELQNYKQRSFWQRLFGK